MSVAIIDVQFDEEFTKAVAELAKEEKNKEVVLVKAEQLKISAAAQAEADIILAEAEAKAAIIRAKAEVEALRLKGATENEIREHLGKILENYPELIKEVLAQNFPKVYGGGTMINLDNLLNP